MREQDEILVDLIKKDKKILKEYRKGTISLLRALVEAERVSEIPVDLGLANIALIQDSLMRIPRTEGD